jgi:DNA-binding response OmpR family regulator
MERPVEMAPGQGGTWIIAIGEMPDIRNALPSAIRNEGWQWDRFPTLDTFLAAPIPPRTIVLPVIDTFTMMSLKLIHDIAVVLGLPVVVLGLERHPMRVKAALEAGADDVIPFPTCTAEVIARLRAIARVALPQDDG